MAENNAANVAVGKPQVTGGVWVAPYNPDAPAYIPTDATTALTSAWTNTGYISEDGLTNSQEADTESFNAWGGDEVYIGQTSRSETFTLAFIETNDTVLKTIYGNDNVTGNIDEALTVLHNSEETPYQSFCFEILIRGTHVKRLVVPYGRVTDIGDITYTDSDLIAYEITINALPYEGNTVYEYVAPIPSAPVTPAVAPSAQKSEKAEK